MVVGVARWPQFLPATGTMRLLLGRRSYGEEFDGVSELSIRVGGRGCRYAQGDRIAVAMMMMMLMMMIETGQTGGSEDRR